MMFVFAFLCLLLNACAVGLLVNCVSCILACLRLMLLLFGLPYRFAWFSCFGLGDWICCLLVCYVVLCLVSCNCLLGWSPLCVAFVVSLDL